MTPKLTRGARARTPPTEIARGVWRITIPLPFRPREVHAYLAELAEGRFVLIDGGIDTDDAWAVLDAGVRMAAGGWGRVAAHVVTHMHIDHFGLARRVREAGVPRLAMGELDAERAAHATTAPGEEAGYRATLFRDNGAPTDLWRAARAAGAKPNPLVGFVAADDRLRGASGPLPALPGWSFQWTPGHTAGHVSLLREADGMLIAGDAVLPHITPTIGVNRQRTDPVGDYLEALARLGGAGIRLVLPGHGDPITDSDVRLRELRDATLAETRAVEALLSDEPRDAWIIAAERYAGRDLPTSAQVLAFRETLAHLHHLVTAGRAHRVERCGGVGFRRARSA